MKSFCIFLVIALLPFSSNLLSQNVSSSVIALTGDHRVIPGKSQITWTLGEPVIDPLRTQDLLLTQGFHQPELRTVTSFVDPGFEFQLSIFPNPTNGQLALKTTYPDKIKYYLADMSGRTLVEGIFTTEQILEVKQLNAGTYCIYLLVEGRLVRSDLISKN